MYLDVEEARRKNTTTAVQGTADTPVARFALLCWHGLPNISIRRLPLQWLLLWRLFLLKLLLK
jgi:hypothetical protein